MPSKEQGLKENLNQGFSLLELLVAMALMAVVTAAVYSTFYSQHKSYISQGQIAAIQQNLRVAMYLIGREIRMAGCDPLKRAHAGIKNTGWDPQENRYTSIRFTLDITNDSGEGDPDGDTDDPNEDVSYYLSDVDGDGDNDLRRNNQRIAENVDALDLVYLDENGKPTTTLANIRSVQVSLLARGARGDPGYRNTRTYRNQQGKVIYRANDNFRRRLLTTDIKCRNFGL